ncbi:hypothetical protein B7463_g5614, partial [Scytalidium lignicola]
MRFSLTTIVKAVTVLTAVGGVDAFWRMPCRSRSGLARIDPLMNNGTVSPHAHSIFGSSGFGESSAYNDLAAGDCTSCGVTQDKSAYWTPTLHFKSASGEFTLVDQVGGMLSYYLLYPNSDSPNVTAFPPGFQMIAGDTYQRNFSYPIPDVDKSNWTGNLSSQAFLRQAAIGMNCLNYQRPPEGSLYRHFLPDKAYLDANCADGIRAELMFPSCWNGKDLDSPNHKDHVAYPNLVMTGDCPPDYPIRLVSLFYESIWNTAAFIGQDGEFVFSNGDPTGCGYHGDFIMGWDEKFLQDAVNKCTNPSGQIQDCPLFTIQSDDDAAKCQIDVPAALQNEKIAGPSTSLPGNVVIANGPGYAQEIQEGRATATASPAAQPATLSYSAGAVASSGTFMPGNVFYATTASAASPTLTKPGGNVNAVVIPTDTVSFFSTAYETSGHTVKEIFMVEETVTISIGTTTTVTIPAPTVSAAKHKRHGHQH